MPVNYQNGKVYKIVSNQTDKVYVGSTTQSLARRKSKHMSNFKMWKSGHYKNITSFEIIKLGDCQVILIENYPCNSKEELESRERYWIESLNCVNKVIPTRTPQEYREVNKEKIRCEQAVRNKRSYTQNKTKIDQQNKKYQLDHIDEIKQHKSRQFVCCCGVTFTHSNRARHSKTIKHNDFMAMYHDAKLHDPAFFEAIDNWHQSKIYQQKHM
ncbi:MAG: GIY-YIG nuclease family protein [Candidatus Babeliales bacterium]|nr:GIY-YIG nuclease family protein [Candidatus Babeliales bacterium]